LKSHEYGFHHGSYRQVPQIRAQTGPDRLTT
jgi:hypothetical protein